jgi:DNA invertase Pin-like site-specific DNA recombinase
MLSPDLQLAAIQAHCEREGYEIVEVLADIDETGRKWDGRKIERAVTALEQGSADVLVVSRWSRITRNRADWTMVTQRVEDAGASIESASEPIDVSTSAGRFIRNLMAEQAAFESDRQADYAREKNRRRVREGLPPDGFERFGYRKFGREYVPDRIAGDVLADMYRQYIAGGSFLQIARWLGQQSLVAPEAFPRLTSPNRLADILDHGFGAGLIFTANGLLPGRHDSVISAETWQAYQAVREVRRRNLPLRLTPDSYVYAGFIFCGECGADMLPGCQVQRRIPTALYRCSRKTGPKVIEVRCNRSINQRVLDRGVVVWLSGVLADAELCHRARQGEARRSELSRRRLRDYELEMSRSEQESSEQMREWERLSREACYRDPVTAARALVEDWHDLNPSRRRARLCTLVRYVTVNDSDPARRGVRRSPRTCIRVCPVWEEGRQAPANG